MQNNTSNSQLQLHWHSEYYKGEELIQKKEKPSTQSIEEFTQQELKQATKVVLEYSIDSINLGKWLNETYFQRHAIGEGFVNYVSCLFRNPELKDRDYPYTKVAIKRLLGQLITLEDATALEYTYTDDSPEKEKKYGHYAPDIVEEENEDTMLYCSGCCFDRMCEHMSIRVYHTNTHIEWFLRLDEDWYWRFPKEQYFKTLEPLVEWINPHLLRLQQTPIDLYAEGERRPDRSVLIQQIQAQYKVNAQTLTTTTLQQILKQGHAPHINAAIAWAKELGKDITPLKDFVEAQYEQLSEAEKNSISWKMIDKSAYYDTLELCEPVLIKKALLLFEN